MRRGRMYHTITDVMTEYAEHMDAYNVPAAERLTIEYVRDLAHTFGRYEDLPADFQQVLADHTNMLLGIEVTNA
jgi:hypothetical protein